MIPLLSLFGTLTIFLFFAVLYWRDESKSWEDNAKVLGDCLENERKRHHDTKNRLWIVGAELEKLLKHADAAKAAVAVREIKDG